MGMDVDQVTAAGMALKDRAAEIDTLVAKLDGIVRSTHGVWEGADSDQFVNEWWPEHKKTLVAASSHVAGLGQSALNNASEQQDASHASRGSTNGGSALPPSGGPVAPTPQAAPVDNSARLQAWSAGALGQGMDVDKSDGKQCVDVIKDYANHIYPGVSSNVSLGTGNAKDYFAGANPDYFDKIPASSGAQPGDIICIGPNHYSPDNGHVAVVDFVDSRGQVHVIQQNGNDPQTVTYKGVISSVEMAAAQGYLRPKA
jgi:surface antigen